MARRSNSLFNLSFLDLLTSALGAIIFLFIITPKGGESAAKVQQALVYFDSTQMKIHGELPDSLLYKNSGDTLLMVLLEYKDLPKASKAPKKIFAFNEPKKAKKPEKMEKPINQPPVKKEEIKKPKEKPKAEEKKPAAPTSPPVEKPSKEPKPKPLPSAPIFKGDAPSVPCKVSFEVSWADITDNVDLFVCRGSSCVYGGRKKDRNIGQWDSGKARNRLFGNDLRTTQEAIRQYDKIIPGEYKLYAQLKESKQKKTSIAISGLIFTKGKSGVQRGETFSKTLKVSKERTYIGTVILQADGNYQFKK